MKKYEWLHETPFATQVAFSQQCVQKISTGASNLVDYKVLSLTIKMVTVSFLITVGVEKPCQQFLCLNVPKKLSLPFWYINVNDPNALEMMQENTFISPLHREKNFRRISGGTFWKPTFYNHCMSTSLVEDW